MLPPLVDLALLVGGEVGVALKKLCAFLAVVLAQAGQVLYGLFILEGGQMLVVAQVGVDLVQVARVAARLLLGVLSAYGWHGEARGLREGSWIRGRRLSVMNRRSRVRESLVVGTAASRGPCASLQVKKA